VNALKSLADFNLGEMKFPDTKIGETVTRAEDWLSGKIEKLEIKPSAEPVTPAQIGAAEPVPVPPKIPLPPFRPRIHGTRRRP
jgi:hypothetical protein